MSRGIEDKVDNVITILILVAEYVTGNFDKIGVELAFVPLGKAIVHLLIGHTEPFLHHLIGLAYHLHIAVLDAVVHHFNEVSCSVFSYPVTAGFTVFGLGADCLENGLDVLPGRR